MLFEQMRTNIALIENFGLDFLNFRVPLVKYLEQNNFNVISIIPKDDYFEMVKQTGIKVVAYELKKNTFNPVLLFQAVKQLRGYQKEYGFTLVHSFRLQPNITSSLAFGFNREVKIINHITGLGYAFTGKSFSSFFYRSVIVLLYQLSAYFSNRIIVQNNEDMRIISKLAFTSGKMVLIEGSGIDLKKFSRTFADHNIIKKFKQNVSYTPGDIIITFTGRILKEKGLYEFLEAARALSATNPQYKFLIAGWFDFNNPSCISPDQLKNYLIENRIIYLGGIFEVRELLAMTDIFVLPTYREGFPRSVIEAMAMEIAVVTTDVPGARESITDNFNGLLIPVKDVEALTKAIIRLSSDSPFRKKLGANGRYLAENKYDSNIIFKKIVDVYKGV
ncbi:MAG: N,N'-diacetylbacillosaminyl-diphospho-undecaprenol alpha-1,3-N-acetylgalactosaminyltransferase [Bacteroidetes bacterium ADurb.Bin145]|jgi:N,N'-diacetylbacillosaminyl-diphospho-undecaprenol alpha-1,3-N-acetylgalactosaminyltransferase|nr:MAG: N,N'-diacetylbacillosaminyl-diphospho-undecaprenol alpha-1,3-N-acetylgalactosaminyltransferase [Bacteroidetes bacterium ADurb.Bin145]